jgi:protein-disulfide isomerase
MMRTLLLLLPALVLSAQTAPAPKTAKSAKPVVKTASLTKAAAPITNYKEMGSPSATISIEAYTDYECPHCARFFKEFMPQFTRDYIQTGKVKFLHRDFPLPQHPHAQLAARYANAAGELGFYDVVVNQIFNTQDDWSVNGKNTGDLDGEVAKVLSPEVMKKVRELVKSDPHLDDSIKGDVTMGQYMDHIPSTPTIVVVSKGKRELITTIMEMPYSIFKKYLDGKLAAQ